MHTETSFGENFWSSLADFYKGKTRTGRNLPKKRQGNVNFNL